MLHLLPQYQKRKVVKEYRLRLGFVLLMLVFLSVLIFTVFTLPTYISLKTEKNLLQGKKVNLESLINLRSGTNSSGSNDIAKSISTLKPYEKSISPNLFIDATSPDSAGVLVNGYAFNQAGPTDPVSVVISGVAKTREDLTGYADTLNKRFGGVKLPLSSLANSSNITFDFRFSMTYDKALEVAKNKESSKPEVLGTSTSDLIIREGEDM